MLVYRLHIVLPSGDVQINPMLMITDQTPEINSPVNPMREISW